MLRIGLAGCGWAGDRHAEAIDRVSRADLVAIADADPATRQRRAAEWDVEAAFGSYRTLIEEATLDALVVALPHHLHRDAAVRAAEAGLDVLCEKPIARTTDEADAMLDAAAEAGTALVVAESARYEPWVRSVDARLAEGAIGRPVFAEYDRLADYGGAYGYDRSDWLNDPERLGGGPWLLNGVHNVSVLRGWLAAADAGGVDRVFAREFRTPAFESPAGIEANVGATLAFESGTTAVVRLGVETPHADEFDGVRIHGTEGTLAVDGDGRVRVHGDGEPTTVRPDDGDAFADQMRAFVETVVDGDDSRTPGRRERNTLAVVLAGYRSLEHGDAATPALRR
jgi:predicted dehydrogenase